MTIGEMLLGKGMDAGVVSQLLGLVDRKKDISRDKAISVAEKIQIWTISAAADVEGFLSPKIQRERNVFAITLATYLNGLPVAKRHER